MVSHFNVKGGRTLLLNTWSYINKQVLERSNSYWLIEVLNEIENLSLMLIAEIEAALFLLFLGIDSNKWRLVYNYISFGRILSSKGSPRIFENELTDDWMEDSSIYILLSEFLEINSLSSGRIMPIFYRISLFRMLTNWAVSK